jgi:rubrerythrin
MSDEVDRRPIEERIAAVRAQEEAGELPTAEDQAKDWTCPECGFSTEDPQEILRHQAIHNPAAPPEEQP